MRAFLGLHVDLTKRYFAWDMVWFCYHLIAAFTVGYIGVSSGVTPSYVPAGQSFTAYLLIGSVLWSYLTVIFWIVADTIAIERWEGTLEYTMMAPVHRLTHLTGVALVGIIYSFIRTILMFFVLWWAFGLSLSGADVLSAAVSLAVGSIAVIGLGLCCAVLPLLSAEKGEQTVSILSALLLLASGVYYPITILPDWIRWLAYVNPVYWLLEAQRKALLAGEPLSAALPDIGWLALTGACYIPLGYWFFAWAERHAKKTGLLKRSG
jgi:ABC-2 type transport system permease protein